MTRRLDFFIVGRPVPQGNHRQNRYGKTYETTRGHAEWRRQVALSALIARTHAGAFASPVTLGLDFYLLRPQRASRPLPSVKPDLSKLVRCLEDGLVEGQLLADDALVVGLEARKHYATPGTQPCGCRVRIEERTAQ